MFWNARTRRTVARRRRPAVECLEGRLTPTTLPTGFTDTQVASGFSNPTAMEFSPDGRLFVLEQGGNVKLVHGDGSTFTALHLNVDSAGERGLLGIAFDPNFANNHYVYLYYTNPNAGASSWATGEHNQLSRFTVNDSNLQQPTFGSEAPILDWNNLSGATNHNGGAIHFGADGMLYADAGDNVQTFVGPDHNTYRVSQTLANLLGKQLRIDVSKFNSGLATRDDTTVGHLIPSDNPFVGTATGINQLIYALGLRNPYTFAVQPGTGKIFINDVGENNWEEIDQSIAGGNYGWQGGNTDGFGHPPPSFAAGTYHDPLLAYSHAGPPGGIAIVGGTFYNPQTVSFPSSYVGKYFYEDLGNAWIRVFDPANPGTINNPDTSMPFASGTPGGLRDLKVDAAGNLYYLAGGDGTVHRIAYTANNGVTILDDSSGSGFTTTGTWTPFSGQGYNNNVHYAAAGSGSSVATWTFTGLTPGVYEVSATWSPNPNRATNAPYTVSDGSLPVGTALANQQMAPSGFSDAGALWQDLGGPYDVTGSTLTVTLSNAANGYVIADAIRIARQGNLPTAGTAQVFDGTTAIANGGSDNFGSTSQGSPITRTFVVRNVGQASLTLTAVPSVPAGFTLMSSYSAGTALTTGQTAQFVVRFDANASASGTVSLANNGAGNPFTFTVSGTVTGAVTILDDSSPNGFSTTGSWTPFSGQGYNNNVHYSPAGNGSSVATWTFSGLSPGVYRISATWSPNPNRATNAPYTVSDGGLAIGTAGINQQAAPNGFSDAGAMWQDLGGPYDITGSTLKVTLSNAANGYVIADAVRVERLGNLPSAATAQVFDGATAIPSGSSDNFGTTSVGSPITRTFVVRNVGQTSLTLTAVPSVPAGFTLMSSYSAGTVLTTGQTAQFVVRFDASASASGTVSLANNGVGNPFTFTVSGTVNAVTILDDSGPGFSMMGSWTNFVGQGYLNNVHYSPAGNGSSVATWTFTGLAPGTYEVSATWSPDPNRATNAPYTVITSNSTTVMVNQQQSPAALPGGFMDQGTAWVDLGGPYTLTGSTLTVQLSNNANGYVIADAIRIKRLS